MKAAGRLRPFAGAVLLLAALPAQTDVAALVQRLGGDDASLRSEAYTELMRLRPPEAVALLGKAIGGFPLAGQNLAGWLLQQYPLDDTRKLYRQLLQHDSALLRVIAAAPLWRAGERDVEAVLAAAIGAAGGEELELLLNRLFGIDAPAIASAVRGRLREASGGSAIEAALYHLLVQQRPPDPATARAAEALLAAADARTVAAAAAWLVARGQGQHGPALVAALQQSPQLLPSLQRFLDRAPRLDEPLLALLVERLAVAKTAYEVTVPARLLQRHAAGRAVSALRELLRRDDEAIRSAALQALAAVPGGLEPRALRELLQSTDERQVLLAAETLRRLDDDAGFEPVLRLAGAGGQRAEAVRVLGGFCRREALAVLLQGLDDAELQVRRNAFTAVSQLLPRLFPYRRFDLQRLGYRAEAPASERASAVAAVRAFVAAH